MLLLECSINKLFYIMKFSEFYKLIEAAGWTLSKGKNIISMFIPTTSTLFRWGVIRARKYRQVLCTR